MQKGQFRGIGRGLRAVLLPTFEGEKHISCLDIIQTAFGVLAGGQRRSFPDLGRTIGVGVLAVGTTMVKRTPRSSIRQHNVELRQRLRNDGKVEPSCRSRFLQTFEVMDQSPLCSGKCARRASGQWNWPWSTPRPTSELDRINLASLACLDVRSWRSFRGRESGHGARSSLLERDVTGALVRLQRLGARTAASCGTSTPRCGVPARSSRRSGEADVTLAAKISRERGVDSSTTFEVGQHGPK